MEKSLVMGLSSVLCPHRGERGQGRTLLGHFPFPPLPWVGRNKEKQVADLRVSKDKLVREVSYPLLKKEKLRVFFEKL
jgi:hypothetical protein